jgi:hypothetical protein
MAATNVQAFSGDVEITSNLAVNGVVLQAGSDVPVRWTSQNETAFTQSASTKYFKIATLGSLASTSNGGLLRISGTIGGFGSGECTLIDAHVGTRGTLKMGGTLNGNGTSSSSDDVDFIVYLESDASFTLWLKLVQYYTFDFTILGARVGGHRTLTVLPCPITDTSVATPSGVSQGSVVSNCSVVFTATGNVGIGTTNPLGLLHLSSGTTGDANLIIESDTDNSNENDNPKITFRQDGGFLEGEIGLSNNHMVFRSKMTTNTNTGFIWYSNVINSDPLISKTDFESLESTQVERMRLTGEGNVGIGTNAPGAPFEVHGPDLTGEAAGTTSLISRHVSGLDGVLNIFGVAAGNGEETLGLQTQIDKRAWADDISGGWATGDASRYDLLLQPYKGTVGIGTTNPKSMLDVKGTILFSNVAYSSDQDQAYLIAGATTWSGAATNWGTHGFQHRIASNSGGTPRIYVDAPEGGEVFTIANGGNVGIGTSNPQQALEVHGNILCGENNQSSLIHGGGLFAMTSDSTILIVCVSNDRVGGGGNDIIFGYGSAADTDGVRSFTYDQAFPLNVPRVETMRIETNTGRVGIGITEPLQQFVVHDASTFAVDCTNASHVVIGNHASSSDSLCLVSLGNINICSDANNNSTQDIAFRTNTSTDGGKLLMILKDSGNVGIGLTNPGTIGSTNYPDVTEVLHLMGNFYQSEPNDNESWSLGIASNDYYFKVSVNGVALSNVIRINYNAGTISDLVTFTGQHRSAHIESIPPTKAIDYEGLIVSADRNQYESVNGVKSRGIKAITVNESVPLLSLSRVAYDKTCFGVVSGSEDPDTRTQKFGNIDSYHHKEPGDTFTFINSLGEGAIWVTNINGSLESGDYITTSNVAGYGQKQDSEFLANYTVAKITMDCDFEPVTRPSQIIKRELGDVDYWMKRTIDSVNFEDYSNLAEENRMTQINTYYSNERDEIDIIMYSNLESNVQSTYTEITRTEYKEVIILQSNKNEDGHDILEVRNELVNVLDENGQMQWEDDPSGATEKAYKIRYIDADGNITDEVSHVYKAAFVGCTYHCG